MLYSEDRKFVFVAVPKTGTTAIQKRLREVDPLIKRNHVHDQQGNLVKVATHATAGEIRDVMGERAKDFTFVAFLRNPQDVIASKYHFYRSGRAAREYGVLAKKDERRKFHPGVTARVLSAQVLPLSIWARFYPFPSSAGYVTYPDGRLAVDHLGTMEHLQEDVLRLFSRFGYSADELELGIANRTEYDRERNHALEQIAQKRLPKDCALYARTVTEARP